MCPPTHFAVEYAINPWMLPGTAVDRNRPSRSGTCCAAPTSTWATASTCWPGAGLPDMVFAANGATVVDGTVLAARFRHPQRAAEAVAHATWFRRAGARVVEPSSSTRARATCSWSAQGRT